MLTVSTLFTVRGERSIIPVGRSSERSSGGGGVGDEEGMSRGPSPALLGQLLSGISDLLVTDSAASSLSAMLSGLNCLLSVYQQVVLGSQLNDSEDSLCVEFLDLVRNLKILPKVVGSLCPDLMQTLLLPANRRIAVASTSISTSDMLLTHDGCHNNNDGKQSVISNVSKAHTMVFCDALVGSEREEEMLWSIREAASRFLQQLESTDNSLFVQCIHHSPLVTYLISTITSTSSFSPSSSSSPSPGSRSSSRVSGNVLNTPAFPAHLSRVDSGHTHAVKDRQWTTGGQLKEWRLQASAAQTDLLTVILRAETRIRNQLSYVDSHFIAPPAAFSSSFPSSFPSSSSSSSSSSSASLTQSALELNPDAPLNVLDALTQQLLGLVHLLSPTSSAGESLKVVWYHISHEKIN